MVMFRVGPAPLYVCSRRSEQRIVSNAPERRCRVYTARRIVSEPVNPVVAETDGVHVPPVTFSSAAMYVARTVAATVLTSLLADASRAKIASASSSVAIVADGSVAIALSTPVVSTSRASFFVAPSVSVAGTVTLEPYVATCDADMAHSSETRLHVRFTVVVSLIAMNLTPSPRLNATSVLNGTGKPTDPATGVVGTLPNDSQTVTSW
jgi:hypothetical protein